MSLSDIAQVLLLMTLLARAGPCLCDCTEPPPRASVSLLLSGHAGLARAGHRGVTEVDHRCGEVLQLFDEEV